MRTIVTRLDKGTVSRVQDAALSRGVTLRHLHQGLFSPDADRRFVGRYLFGLWLSDHANTYDMLRRVLPQGMMHYLHHPRLTDAQRAKLEAEDADRADDDAVLQLRLELCEVRCYFLLLHSFLCSSIFCFLILSTKVRGLSRAPAPEASGGAATGADGAAGHARTPSGSAPSALDASRLVGKLVYCVVYPVDASGTEVTRGKVSVLLCTVTFYANLAHSLTRSPLTYLLTPPSKRRTGANRVRADAGGCTFGEDSELLIGGNSNLRRASKIAIDVMCDDFKAPLGTVRLDVSSLPAQETREWVPLKSGTGEIKITMQRQWVGVDAGDVERRREVGATRLRRSLESAAQRDEPVAKVRAHSFFLISFFLFLISFCS